MLSVLVALVIGFALGHLVGKIPLRPAMRSVSLDDLDFRLNPDSEENTVAIFQFLHSFQVSLNKPVSLPPGAKEMTKLPMDLCPPNPDGPCGFDWIISIDGTSLYVTSQGGAGNVSYGPFAGGEETIKLLQAASLYTDTLKFK